MRDEKLELLKNIDENSSNFFDNFKSEACKECYGESCCCYKFPCIFSPDDFYDINNLEYMKKILDTGLICVNNDNNFYTIRPAGKREIYDEPRYQYNTCILYSYMNGCMLEDYLRPTQGLLYMAKKDLFSKCISLYTKEDIYNEYKEYQSILYKLYNYQSNVMIDIEQREENIKKLVKLIIKKPLQK